MFSELRKALLAGWPALACASMLAQSNVDPAHSIASSPFIGQIDFAPSEIAGARINQFYCAGFLYAENAGWIQLGSGEPADGLSYQNNSATDYGVNVLPSGALRGFAYGANIGWINFSEEGNPRVDWATGRLGGRIYSANTGWIGLESGDSYIRLDSVAPAADSDGDNLPDAWEIEHAGVLLALGRNGDADGDGQTDLEEYLAATNPLNPDDYLALRLLGFRDALEPIMEWSSNYGVVYQLEERAALNAENPWNSASGALTGSGQTIRLQLQADASPTRFFRISAFPPLSSPQ